MNDKPVLRATARQAHKGSAVVRKLVQAGERVRVLARDASKAEQWRAAGAEVAVGDFLDHASLTAAHKNVDKVFLHLPLQYDFEQYKTYGHNAVDAAREAGVKMLVFNTSSHVKDGTAVEVYNVRGEVAEYLRESSVPHIVLRPTLYMDNFIGPWMKSDIVDKGVVAYPLPPNFKMSWVSADDMAAFTVAALNRPDLAGSSFDIGGPEALDGNDLAQRFSQAHNRPVNYVAIPPDNYEQALAGLFGQDVAAAITAQMRWLTTQPHGAIDMSETARLFEREQVLLAQWINQQDWRINS